MDQKMEGGGGRFRIGFKILILMHIKMAIKNGKK
jgi:hypothetical protein